MANEVLIQDVAGSSLSPIVFGVDGELDPADDATNLTDDIGTDTVDVDLDLDALADGAARQSEKADLGAARAAYYNVMASLDFTGETPTDGEVVEFYWAPSTSGTAANGNVAGNSGADAACPDGALNSITLAEFVKLCIYIGSMPVHADGGVQTGFVGTFSPPTRYGQLIVKNESGDAFEADAVESHVVLMPLVYEVQ
jgi:hypothetical protein